MFGSIWLFPVVYCVLLPYVESAEMDQAPNALQIIVPADEQNGGRSIPSQIWAETRKSLFFQSANGVLVQNLAHMDTTALDRDMEETISKMDAHLSHPDFNFNQFQQEHIPGACTVQRPICAAYQAKAHRVLSEIGWEEKFVVPPRKNPFDYKLDKQRVLSSAFRLHLDAFSPAINKMAALLFYTRLFKLSIAELGQVQAYATPETPQQKLHYWLGNIHEKLLNAFKTVGHDVFELLERDRQNALDLQRMPKFSDAYNQKYAKIMDNAEWDDQKKEEMAQNVLQSLRELLARIADCANTFQAHIGEWAKLAYE